MIMIPFPNVDKEEKWRWIYTCLVFIFFEGIYLVWLKSESGKERKYKGKKWEWF